MASRATGTVCSTQRRTPRCHESRPLRRLNWQKMASFSAYCEELRDGSVETWSRKETIAWGLCTSPPTLETFSKKISPSTRSSNEIAGLLKKKKKMKMKKKMTEIVKSRMGRSLRRE